jgi:hypothetical protein
MATHRPQLECRETTRSLFSTSATAPEPRRLADKAMSISRHPAQLLRHLPLRVQHLHSRQRLHQRPQLLLLQRSRLRQHQQLLTRLRQRLQLPPRPQRQLLRLLRQQQQLPLLLRLRQHRRRRLLRPRQLHRGLLRHQGVLRNQGLGRLPRRGFRVILGDDYRLKNCSD